MADFKYFYHKVIFKIFVSILILISNQSILHSSPNRNFFLVSPGIGTGTAGNTANIGILAGLDFNNIPMTLSGYYSFTEQRCGNFFGCYFLQKLSDIGVLVGINIQDSNRFILASVGIGYLTAELSENQILETFGMPIDFRSYIIFRSTMCIGLFLQGNINSLKTYFGGGISIAFGITDL